MKIIFYLLNFCWENSLTIDFNITVVVYKALLGKKGAGGGFDYVPPHIFT